MATLQGVNFGRRSPGSEGQICTPNNNDKPVLIDNIHIVETVEGPVPSLMRLEPFHQRERLVASALEGSQVVLGHTYWEFGIARGLTAPVFDQRISEGIESRASVMHAITKDEPPLGWNFLGHVQLKHALLRTRIELADDAIRLSGDECFDFGVELVKVGYGPIDLPATVQ